MHVRSLAVCVGLTFVSLGSVAHAAPAIGKETLGPMPSESNLSRDQALAVLVEGEGLLGGSEDEIVAGLTKMLEAYIALEASEGPEAPGVKELRSWLVKTLEEIGLTDEAGTLRARGSYVDHPLSILPSTWFAGGGVVAGGGGGEGGGASSAAPGGNQGSIDAAVAAVDRGLKLLEQGDAQGLTLLLDAYEILEREVGAEQADVVELRSFLVGLLEFGGYTDNAAALRTRGSVRAASEQDNQVYAATWIRILGEEQGAATDTTTDQGSVGEDTSSSPTELTPSAPEPSPSDDGDDDDKPKVLEPGSLIPGVDIDIGVGTYQPEYGRKGLLWTLGLGLRWRLFTAKFFSMQIGGGGQFGRNRDKRWLADAHAELGLGFDFRKVYIQPEFGGGYDQIAGGELTIAQAHKVAPAGYYHFGGTFGVRFADRFGIYARAVRLNRADRPMPNETRARAGLLVDLDSDVAVDAAFVFTDYDARDDGNGARLFSGNLGFRF